MWAGHGSASEFHLAPRAAAQQCTQRICHCTQCAGKALTALTILRASAILAMHSCCECRYVLRACGSCRHARTRIWMMIECRGHKFPSAHAHCRLLAPSWVSFEYLLPTGTGLHVPHSFRSRAGLRILPQACACMPAAACCEQQAQVSYSVMASNCAFAITAD